MTDHHQYPPAGTRVRWTSRGKTREGVVSPLGLPVARSAFCAFKRATSWPRDERGNMAAVALVVEVDTINGEPRRRGPRYYRPRAGWLEVAD